MGVFSFLETQLSMFAKWEKFCSLGSYTFTNPDNINSAILFLTECSMVEIFKNSEDPLETLKDLLSWIKEESVNNKESVEEIVRFFSMAMNEGYGEILEAMET